MGVNWLEDMSLAMDSDAIMYEQNLLTLHTGEEYKLTSLKSKKKDVIDHLQTSIQRTEDMSAIEQVVITAVKSNKESDLQYCDRDNVQLSASSADHQSDEQVDSDEGISGSSETSTASIDAKAVAEFPATIHSEQNQDVLHSK